MSEGAPRPPRLAERFLRATLPEAEREYVLGDLEEIFGRLAKTDPAAARRAYWKEALGAAVERLRRAVGGREHTPGAATGRDPARALHDVRIAFRSLLRHPVVSAVVVGTLALAIGSLTVIVTVVDGVLVRPLPFPEGDRLVALCTDHASMGDFCGASPPDAAEWERSSPALAEVGLVRDESVRLRTADGVEGLYAALATPSTLHLLSTPVHMGRAYTDAEQAAGAPVVMLGYNAWVSRFGADPGVVGRRLDLDGRVHEVVGVLGEGAWIPPFEEPGLLRPLPFAPDDEENRAWRGFRAIGRLAPGWTVAAAQAQLDGVALVIGERLPESNAGWGVQVESLKSRLVAPVRARLRLFLAGVTLLLLVACANVTGILVARAAQREGEMALRAALGASRIELLRVLASEALLLGVAGSASGVLIARLLLPTVIALAPTFPRAAEVGLDMRVLALVAAVTTAVVAAAALVPALAVRLGRLATALGQARAGLRSQRVHRAVVLLETAFAVALLAGATLLGRSFQALMRYDGGVDRSHLLTSWLVTVDDPSPPAADVVRAHAEVAKAVAALPGVESAALASAGPLFGGSDGKTRFFDAARPRPPAGTEPSADWFDVSPGLFRTLGVPLLSGREFNESDDGAAARVVLVNQAFQSRHWPGESAVGHRIVLAERGDVALEVVGVVPDMPALGALEPVEPAMYWPLAQWPRLAAYLVVRTTGDPGAMLEAVRERARGTAPATQVGQAVPLDESLRTRTHAPRSTATLMSLFAATALLLTGLGVYGVTAYAVSRRQHELAVRASLGLGRAGLRLLVLRQATGLALSGVALGLMLAAGLAPLLEASLVGVSARDPLALGLSTAVVLVVGALAAWIPGGRAARVDPAGVLRGE